MYNAGLKDIAVAEYCRIFLLFVENECLAGGCFILKLYAALFVEQKVMLYSL